MAENIVQAVNWTLWIEVPGGSPFPMNFQTPLSINATALADAYIDG